MRERPVPAAWGVGVDHGLRGWFAVLYDAAGPVQTGIGSDATAVDAWHEACEWAESEGLPLPERPREPGSEISAPGVAAVPRDTLDVRVGGAAPAAQLSNFMARRFVFDAIDCGSMEGLLQSLKFEDLAEQREVCRLAGLAAKRRGAGRTAAWQAVQTLWWRGEAMRRDSDMYQRFLDRAYYALVQQSAAFRAALLATGEATLTHVMGNKPAAVTILTEHEFCSRLQRIRTWLRTAETRP